MKKTVYIYLFAILSITNSFGQSNFSSYKIVGMVTGYTNGTMLYLNDVTDGSYKKIDSAVISNERFSFNGQVKTAYIRSSITSADFEDRASFWLEKGNTFFSAAKGNFNKAIINGSKIQAEQNRLNRQRDTAKIPERVEYLFVKNNPASVVSAYILSVYQSTWPKDSVARLYQSFSKKNKSTAYAKRVFEFISLSQDIKIGDKFVDFVQVDSAGRNIKLSEYSGKVILLEFWGSWCGPCREENPSLLKIYDEFKNKGFEIFAVASETNKRQWIDAINADGLKWINVTDLKGDNNKAALIYAVSGYPSNFLIDRSGTIIAKELYGEDLRNFILKIL